MQTINNQSLIKAIVFLESIRCDILAFDENNQTILIKSNTRGLSNPFRVEYYEYNGTVSTIWNLENISDNKEVIEIYLDSDAIIKQQIEEFNLAR